MGIHTVDTSPEMVACLYESMERNLSILRSRLGRPMTLTEKILLSHLDDPARQDLEPGQSQLTLRPDRVALQDVLGQTVVLQFMQIGRNRVSVPTTVHCDHLIQARVDGKSDTEESIIENEEVYGFLRSAAAKYGMGFWKPGAGIIHQVVLENYAFPGGVMIGTDSHTPNAGGLGMMAIGVGGADAVEVMSGLPWEVLFPRRIGVHLTGKLDGWTAPKDIILYLAGVLTVEGATNSILEYFGPGVHSISCTGKATITNMGAELGATTSLFPYDERMATYLRATGRCSLADLADRNLDLLTADFEVWRSPNDYFDKIVEIDLSMLEPQVVGPHSPDLARPISKLAEEVVAKGYPEHISTTLIGSCTNSSYEDMSRAMDVARQASNHGISASVPLMVTPGSEQIRATIGRDGQMEALQDIGASVLANACGPCIGQWKREGVTEGKSNSIVTSYNRNFPRRNDGRAETMNFIASPEIVIAYSLSGRLTFNPLTDTLIGSDGRPFTLDPPKPADEVPTNGFVVTGSAYIAPPENGEDVEVIVSPTSDRLEKLAPFLPWDGKDFVELPILVKVTGKCTTDHISPAGPWLKYRGHLTKFSENMFMGATNAYTSGIGNGLNQITGETEQAFSQIAKRYQAAGLRWVVVGDQNYGEGSSREHAAMSPRLLGAAAVIVRSFARIHESNLKKQGLLPLSFWDPEDYDLIQETDRISLIGLNDLAPGKDVLCYVHHVDGTSDILNLRHTFSQSQISWFREGSALNLMR